MTFRVMSYVSVAALCWITASQASAQEKIYGENFEGASFVGYSTLDGAFASSGPNYFDRGTNGVPFEFLASMSGFQGSFFVAFENIDNIAAGLTDPHWLALDPVDVSRYKDLAVQILVGATNTTTAYDDSSFLRVEYSIDGGAFEMVGNFIGDAGGSLLKRDTDLDNVGDVALTPRTLERYTFSIPDTGNSLVIRVFFSSTEPSQEIAFDDIRIRGTLVTVCGDAMCEGTEDTTNCVDDCGSQCGDGACNGAEGTTNCVADCGQLCGDGTCNGSEGTTNCVMDCGQACGDGTCNGTEGTTTCADDCGSSCGDTVCNGSESTANCVADCGQSCGDGACNGTEDTASCAADCGSDCGDGSCNGSESTANCVADCGQMCGDGTCNGTESTSDCVLDCGSSCGDGTCNGAEGTTNCVADCGMMCGDGTCNGAENSVDCVADCGSNCGDGTCNGSEGTANCVDDCGMMCGDGTCNGTESTITCIPDCGTQCGDGTINGQEICEPSDLAGESCERRGFESGTLACAGDCLTYDTSGCVPFMMDGGMDGGFDGSIVDAGADAAVADATVPDAALPDAMLPDSGGEDAMVADASEPDAQIGRDGGFGASSSLTGGAGCRATRPHRGHLAGIGLLLGVALLVSRRKRS